MRRREKSQTIQVNCPSIDPPSTYGNLRKKKMNTAKKKKEWKKKRKEKERKGEKKRERKEEREKLPLKNFSKYLYHFVFHSHEGNNKRSSDECCRSPWLRFRDAAKSNYGGTEERNAPLCQNFITAVITLQHPNECKITEILWHVKCQHIKKLYFNVTLFKMTGSINSSCTKELVKRYRVGAAIQHLHREETSTRCMRYNSIWREKNGNVQ